MEQWPGKMNGKGTVIHLNKLENGDQFDLVVLNRCWQTRSNVMITAEKANENEVSYW